MVNSENSPAIYVANRGYDVWLGASRGLYTRKHLQLDPETDKEYWNFDWQEQGRYDSPAFISYITDYLQVKKISIVAYSQAT